VDTGDDENYTIVCGAPNIRSGIKVPVAKVGATLQNGEFKIKEAKLRGVQSSGMICSGRELAINNDHEGIMIIDTDEKLGTPIENIYGFKEDVIFELDLTPNRGDCLSHLGVARELGIATDQIVERRMVKPVKVSGSTADDIIIHIDAPDGCPRYSARAIKGVKISPSPHWLSDRLNSIGSIHDIIYTGLPNRI
jgi:phenylalanyl-tRNA synthetase beta chain